MEKTKSEHSPRFSLGVFVATSLLGLVVAVLVQWVFNKTTPAPETPGQVTVAYMKTHAGQQHNALLVFINRDRDKIKIDDISWPAPKWVGSAWEELVAAQLDIGNFDRAFEIVRTAPNSGDRGAALHNILHVARVSPRARLPVYGSTTYEPTPVAAGFPANDDNVVSEPLQQDPVDFPTVGDFKPETKDLPIAKLPAEHRKWVALTIDRLKTAESIARELEPLPVVYGAWLDIKYNYESLQQWASAERARTAAIQVLVAYDTAQYWQAFREAWVWPAVKAILAALGLGLGAVILDYYKKALQFYSARGLGALVQDEEFRKHLGLVAKDVQSALILPGSDGQAKTPREPAYTVKPR